MTYIVSSNPHEDFVQPVPIVCHCTGEKYEKILIWSHRVLSGGNQDWSPTFIHSLLGLLSQRYQKLGGLEITFIYHSFRGREIQDQGTSKSTVWWGYADTHLLLVPYLPGSSGELSLVFLIRALIPFMRALPSWSSHLSKALPTKTLPLGLLLQYTNSGETQTFRPEQGQEQDWEMGEIKLTLWEVLELAVVSSWAKMSVFSHSPLVSHWMCAAL